MCLMSMRKCGGDGLLTAVQAEETFPTFEFITAIFARSGQYNRALRARSRCVQGPRTGFTRQELCMASFFLSGFLVRYRWLFNDFPPLSPLFCLVSLTAFQFSF